MKAVLLAGIALACFGASAAQAQEMVRWPAPASATGRYAYFPMGTELQLTTRTELNTKAVHTGDRFYLEVAEPLMYRGQVVVPVGSVAVGEVSRAEPNGWFGKRGHLNVRLLYVQTPSGPVRLSGRSERAGTGQGLLSIGGAALVAWPMMFIHGTSGKIPADTSLTAYLADELRFPVQDTVASAATSVMPDAAGQSTRPLPARYDPSVFAANRP